MKTIDFSNIISRLKRTTDKKDIAITSTDLATILGIQRTSFAKLKAIYELKQDGHNYYLFNTINALFLRRQDAVNVVNQVENYKTEQEVKNEDEEQLKEEMLAVKARLIKIQAEKAEFDLAIKKKQYIPTEEVVYLLERLASEIKTSLLRLPRLSQQLLLCATADEIKQVLTKNIDDILTELSELNVDAITNTEEADK